MPTLTQTAQQLIASPRTFTERTDFNPIPKLLALTALGGSVIGMAAGLQHDGLQGLYSAVKMPAMLIIPPLLVLPALLGLAATMGLDLTLQKASVLAIAASARTAIFAAALTPVFWLFGASAESYNASVFGLAATTGVGGLFGWSVLASVGRLTSPVRSLVFTLGAGALFIAAAGQTGWHLRPFVRPPEAPASFLAPPEGDVYSNIKERFDHSAQGPRPSRARALPVGAEADQ